jgi:hypothetical protein
MHGTEGKAMDYFTRVDKLDKRTKTRQYTFVIFPFELDRFVFNLQILIYTICRRC